jgi:hypothetical protein
MAIKLIANYSKRLGLPGYSSHQFSVSVETELMTTDDVAAESGRLYQRLQSTVDEQMLHTGFVPPGDYGMDNPEANPTSIDSASGSAPANVSNVAVGSPWQRGPAWRCSDKQRDLILKLVEEHQLDKAAVEALAVERFGKGVRQLNKVEASGLIDGLLESHGRSDAKTPGISCGRNGSAGTGNRGNHHERNAA